MYQPTQDQVFMNELSKRFHEYVRPIRRGGRKIWKLQPQPSETREQMIWKLKLTLSWVMGESAMHLSPDELLSQIVTRYQKQSPAYVKTYFDIHVEDE